MISFRFDRAVVAGRFLTLSLMALVAGESLVVQAQVPFPAGPEATTARSKPAETRGAWLKDSRFAMFIHWGLYSELAGSWEGRKHYGIGEWIMNRARIPAAEYAQVAGRFNPVDFDAAAWIRLARDAGMRHIMFTAKHHDGFAMFKSAVSPFDIVDASPFQRDPLQELAEACRAEGLRLGLYYSQTQDWHEPDAVGNSWDQPAAKPDFQRYLTQKAIPQVEEILRNYGPVAGVWFDTPGPITPAQSRSLVELVHRLQPGALVNSRIGNDLGDYDTLQDHEIPSLPRAGLWESIDTTNDTWGYVAYDRNWKSPREIAHRLVRVVSRGGTYMINVGPDGRGRIPEECARILRRVGEWVGANAAAIHGTDPSPFGPLAWGECTARDNTLYLHIFDWPRDGRLQLPHLSQQISSVRFLGGGALTAIPRSGAWEIAVPPVPPAGLIPVIAVTVVEPVQIRRDHHVLGGHRNVLTAGQARLLGCASAKVGWMEKFGDWKHADCIGGWQGRGSEAVWQFQTTGASGFYLEVEYTCPSEDDYAEWRVTLDGRETTFPLIDTGERDHRAIFADFNQELPRFRTYRVGVVELPAAGSHTLTIGPAGSAGSRTRITAVHLVPVD